MNATAISEQYRAQNRELHARDSDYGAGLATQYWYSLVEAMIKSYNPASILDYGCGKGRFGSTYPHLMVEDYDPAIPGKDAPPVPAEMVVCMDVLEHIEPDCLDALLNDLKRVTLKWGFFTVGTAAAKKCLPDGRNAHLIQAGPEFWLPKIISRFELQVFRTREKGEPSFAVMVTAKGAKI